MQQNFKTAFLRLREIQEKLETEEIIDVDELINLQKEAKELYEFCESKIKKLDDNIKN
jgi:hypothetical protein